MLKYYALAVIVILMGAFLIYQNTISFDRMTKVNSKILEKSLEVNPGRTWIGDTIYSMDFKTNSLNYIITLGLGYSYDETYYDSLSNLFDTNKVYTFYLNPLWGTKIEKVEFKNSVIYKSNRGNEGIIWGSIIILVTLISIIYKRIKYKKDTPIPLLHPLNK